MSCVFAFSNELKPFEQFDLDNSKTECNPKKNTPPLCAHRCNPENHATLVKTHHLSIHCLTPSIKDQVSKFIFPNDHAMIKEALESYKNFNIDFTFEVFQTFLLNKLLRMRQENQLNECCGLKGTQVKKIKCLINLHTDKRIEKILIGIFFAKGAFTKVYLTLNGKAILIPRKDRDRSEAAIDQMNQAHKNCLQIHFNYLQKKKHSDKIKELLTSLNLFENNFGFERKLILDALPPLPEMTDVHGRPIMILPRATPARNIFYSPPTSCSDIIKRIKILRDIAFSLALFHEEDFVLGDIKPDNLLVNSKGVGQLHDFGGSDFFKKSDNPTIAADKYSAIMTTPHYTHYRDRKYYESYIQNKNEVRYFLELGQSRDVFALAVSTVRAMIGIVDSTGKSQQPYHEAAYKESVHRSYSTLYINGTARQRIPVTCIQAISPEADADFQGLLDCSLEPNYFLRPTAHEYAVSLHQILKKLTS